MITAASRGVGTSPPPAVWALSVIASALLWWSTTPFGIGLTPDSVHYLSGAENLRHGLGYVVSIPGWNSAGATRPILAWPPAYPALLAALGFMSPVTASLVVNVCAFGLTTFVAGLCVWTSSGSAVASTVASAMVTTHLYALSEPLFTLLLLVGAARLVRLARNPTTAHLAIAAAIAALATLTRWPGAVLTLVGAVVLMRSGDQLAARVRRTILFVALSLAPPALWMARNLQVTGTIGGPDAGARYSPGDAVRQALTTIRDWVIPGVVPAPLAWALLLVVFVTLTYFLFTGRNAVAPPPAAIAPFVLVAAAYVALVLAVSVMRSVDPIGSRLLVPIVPLATVILASAPRVRDAVTQWRADRVLAAQAVCLFTFVLLAPAAISLRQVAYTRERTQGAGYRAAKWRTSDMLAAAATHSGPFAGRRVFTNEPEAVLASGGGPVRSMRPPWDNALADVPSLFAAVGTSPSAVALFHSDTTPTGRADDESLERSGLFERAGRFDAGCVFLPLGHAGTK